MTSSLQETIKGLSKEGLTQRQIGAKLGCSQSFISHVNTGKQKGKNWDLFHRLRHNAFAEQSPRS